MTKTKRTQTLESSKAPLQRPILDAFQDPADFVAAMLSYQKIANPSFSVLKKSQALRRISPTLISLIIRKKRKITPDRIDELAILLNLSVPEKFYFRNWILDIESQSKNKNKSKGTSFLSDPAPSHEKSRLRKNISPHILNDWLNIYVKDCFQIPEIRKHPEKIFSYLQGIATRKRIEKSLKFLLREGHLRRMLNGEWIPDVPLAVIDPGLPSAKIRQFHKATLKIASSAIDTHGPDRRLANALLLPLNAEKYQEFLKIIEEFSLKIRDFSSQLENEDPTFKKSSSSGSSTSSTSTKQPELYQFIINLSPLGGYLK